MANMLRSAGLIFSVACLVLLAACGVKANRISVADHDLGEGTEGSLRYGAALSGIDVLPSSLLVDDAMHYRLSYGDSSRRMDFAENYWAAPPADLLTLRMQRSLPAKHGGSCRLRIDFDDLLQNFTTPSSSQLELSARVTLVATRPVGVLAQRTVKINQPALSADARGGAMAARLAVQTLTQELDAWLAEPEQSTAIKARCH